MTDHTTDPQEVPLRRCPKCEEFKPATPEYFGINKKRKHGLDGHCKLCKRAYYRANRDRFLPQFRAHYENNKEKNNEASRQYRAANKEKVAASKRDWEIKNKEHVKQQQQAYYTVNKDRRREKTRSWRANNRDADRVINRRRKALNRNAPGEHTANDIAILYARQGGKCAYCQCEIGNSYHVDHIVPLSRGGSNWPDNLAIACPSCNISKRAQLLYTEWTPPNPL